MRTEHASSRFCAADAAVAGGHEDLLRAGVAEQLRQQTRAMSNVMLFQLVQVATREVHDGGKTQVCRHSILPAPLVTPSHHKAGLEAGPEAIQDWSQTRMCQTATYAHATCYVTCAHFIHKCLYVLCSCYAICTFHHVM